MLPSNVVFTSDGASFLKSILPSHSHKETVLMLGYEMKLHPEAQSLKRPFGELSFDQMSPLRPRLTRFRRWGHFFLHRDENGAKRSKTENPSDEKKPNLILFRFFFFSGLWNRFEETKEMAFWAHEASFWVIASARIAQDFHWLGPIFADIIVVFRAADVI